MALTRLTPLGDFVSLREAMDRLFQDSVIRPSAWADSVAVPVDLWESKDGYHLRADLPGLAAEDIQIDATGEGVTIAGEYRAPADVPQESWLRRERATGKFQRSFALPVQIDASRVVATFSNGVLELTLPKSEAVKPKSIKISPR